MHRGVTVAGAGAKIAYELGVVEKLQELGYKWDSASGVSAGAIVAAAIATDRVPQAIQLVLEMGEDKVFVRESWKGMANIFNRKRMGLFNQTERLREMFFDFFHGARLEMPLAIGSVSFETGQYAPHRFFPEDQAMFNAFMVQALMMSSALPGAFYPVNGHLDGGVRHMTPIRDALTFRPDHLTIIQASPGDPAFEELPRGGLPAERIIKILVRAGSISMDQIFDSDLSAFAGKNEIMGLVEQAMDEIPAHVYDSLPASLVELLTKLRAKWRHIPFELYKPDDHLGGTLDFEKATQLKRLDQGRKDATPS